jgi:uncharacterized protein with ParB-like and HNH nuclease domain
MSSKYQIIKLTEIFGDLGAKSDYFLPNFQRDFVWDLEKQRALLASFIAGLPIGSVLLISGDEGTFAARELGFMVAAIPGGNCNYILDGQQRLSTLSIALADPFRTSD